MALSGAMLLVSWCFDAIGDLWFHHICCKVKVQLFVKSLSGKTVIVLEAALRHYQDHGGLLGVLACTSITSLRSLFEFHASQCYTGRVLKTI